MQNILIVDDHQMFIDGLKSLLRKQNTYIVTGEAHNGIEALSVIEKNEFDIILCDISMPEMDGIELTKILKDKKPNIKIIILSMHNDPAVVSEIMMAEAEGYILKNTGKEELFDALNKVSNGGTYYSKDVMTNILKGIKNEKKSTDELKQLSEREIEVLKLIVEEYSSEKIAEKLFISKRTVDTHRINILSKTNCKTLVGLIKFAIRNNLIEI